MLFEEDLMPSDACFFHWKTYRGILFFMRPFSPPLEMTFSLPLRGSPGKYFLYGGIIFQNYFINYYSGTIIFSMESSLKFFSLDGV